MTNKSEKTKFLTAVALSYILCIFIVWNPGEPIKSMKMILLSAAIALILSALLFVIRKKYESSKTVRFAVGMGLLASYVICGLTFRGLIHHAYIVMTMAILGFIGSFIVDLQKE